MTTRLLTRQRLCEVLDYDPATGVFTWREKRGNCSEGYEAGCVEESGYRRIRIDRVPYYAHRLAWLYVHGGSPRRVHHRDGDKLNNRIDNLYEYKGAV